MSYANTEKAFMCVWAEVDGEISVLSTNFV